MSILVVGSVAFDNVETPSGKVENALGGSAVYFSISASFFSPVKIVAVVGTDFPEKHINLLKKHGIDTKGLQKTEGKTFCWTGSYLSDLNTANTINTCLNVFEKFSPKIPEGYEKTPNLFLANIDPDLQLDVLEKMSRRGRPKLIALDTMNLWINSKQDSLKKALNKVDILLINEGEAKQLSGQKNIVKAAKHILSLGTKGVVIKRGEYGAAYFDKKRVFFAPPYPVENVCDPTGAGDSFAGGFFGSLSRSGTLNDPSIKKAMVFGSVMGSFCIENFSMDGFSRLSREQINDRFGKIRKMYCL